MAILARKDDVVQGAMLVSVWTDRLHQRLVSFYVLEPLLLAVTQGVGGVFGRCGARVHKIAVAQLTGGDQQDVVED
jgi:hypothetical protein